MSLTPRGATVGLVDPSNKGQTPLKDFPEKERRLWQILSASPEDWSAQIVEGGTIADLDPGALAFARVQYRQKHPQQPAGPTFKNMPFAQHQSLAAHSLRTRSS
jgi:hypothetical protein